MMSKTIKWLASIVVGFFAFASVYILFNKTYLEKREQIEEPPVPGIQYFSTKNGMKVSLQEVQDIPMVDIRLLVDAGSIHDELGGESNLTCMMLDQGTNKHDVDSIAEGFANIGAIFATNCERDYTAISLRSIADDNLDLATELFLDILQGANFPSETFTQKQAQLLASIEFNKQDPAAIASENFYRLLYPESPYGRTVEGSFKTVSELNPAILKEFFLSHYTNDGAVLAIVGDIKLKQAQIIAEKISNSMRGRSGKKINLPEPKPVKNKEKFIDFPSKQSHIFFGGISVKKGDPDYFPLYVGSHILGGDSLSRLFRNIREEQGLAYSVYSVIAPRLVAGPFVINLQTRNSRRSDALKSVREEFSKFIKNGPTANELIATKKYLIGSAPLRIASNQNKVKILAELEYYNMPHDYLDTFTQKIEAVSLEDIKRVFRKYFDPNEMVTVIVGGE